MTPKEPGYYWLRTYSFAHSWDVASSMLANVGDAKPNPPEIVHVGLHRLPRTRRPDSPLVLQVHGHGWSEEVSKMVDCDWDGPIACTLPPARRITAEEKNND